MKNFLKIILYYPLYNLLIFLVWLMPNHLLGLAIIALTIIIRLLLLPQSLKASRSQVKLQALQPEMTRIKNEIKDQQEQGKALMNLYKREGVSPFSSCLPLLIQFPILIILYKVFRIGIDTSHFSLLYSFTPRPDTINLNFLGLDLAKNNLVLLPLLAGITQFFLSKLTMPPTPKEAPKSENDPQAAAMQMMNKQMIYFFPIMTAFIARSMPAALSLYWITTTLFGIVQQLYVNKTVTKSSEFQKEVKEDETETENEIAEIKEEVIQEKPKKGKKKPDMQEMMANMLNKKLDKQEKKTGVNITIRKK